MIAKRMILLISSAGQLARTIAAITNCLAPRRRNGERARERGVSTASFIFSIAFVAVLVDGCASAPSHFYTLSSTAKADSAPAARYAVVVGPVSVPALVDRPQFTILAGPNRVEVDEFNRWAAPLGDVIARAVAGDLAALLGTTHVAAAPIAIEPAYRVTLHVQRFDALRNETKKNEAVLIEAVWEIRTAAGGAARSGWTAAREPAQGDSFEALTAALSRALTKVSGDIAAAIRAEADEKP